MMPENHDPIAGEITCDIRPILEFFDLFDTSHEATSLIHGVLTSLVDFLGLEIAGYYQASEFFEDQIFLDFSPEYEADHSDSSNGSADSVSGLKFTEELYNEARSGFARLRDHGVDMISDFRHSPSAPPSLCVRVGEGLFIVRRSAEDPFLESELDSAQKLIQVGGRVIDVAIRFANVESQRMQDALTGLSNRRYFDELLPREIERADRFGTEFSLVLMDLDDFKRYNDTNGHRQGDELLKKIGDTLIASLRRVDSAVRYGGDEFALILPHSRGHKVDTLVRRLKQNIKEACESFGSTAPSGASFGVSNFPRDARAVDALVEIADSSLYKAKKEGKKSASAVSPAKVTVTNDQPALVESAADGGGSFLDPKDQSRPKGKKDIRKFGSSKFGSSRER